MDKEIEKKFASHIYRKYDCRLFNNNLSEILDILDSDQDIKGGSRFLRIRYPKVDLNDFEPLLDISGSESVIYVKDNDVEVYKLNDPYLKVDSNRFNDYIISLLLQELLFPDYKYRYIGWVDHRFMLAQKITTLDECTQEDINKCMINLGFDLKDNGNFYGSIDGFIIEISDLNPSNARVDGNDIIGFDPRLKLIAYEG